MMGIGAPGVACRGSGNENLSLEERSRFESMLCTKWKGQRDRRERLSKDVRWEMSWTHWMMGPVGKGIWEEGRDWLVPWASTCSPGVSLGKAMCWMQPCAPRSQVSHEPHCAPVGWLHGILLRPLSSTLGLFTAFWAVE